jgi:hypothetical protein
MRNPEAEQLEERSPAGRSAMREGICCHDAGRITGRSKSLIYLLPTFRPRVGNDFCSVLDRVACLARTQMSHGSSVR